MPSFNENTGKLKASIQPAYIDDFLNIMEETQDNLNFLLENAVVYLKTSAQKINFRKSLTMVLDATTKENPVSEEEIPKNIKTGYNITKAIKTIFHREIIQHEG